MLAELWAYFATPCRPALRRLGYLREAVAIAARHRRCRAAWQPHLRHTRDALLAATDRLERRRTALILGSGHLLDVPLAELAGRFDQVLLVDALHPAAARRQARRYGNVRLIEHDLTECADAVLALPKQAGETDLAELGQRSPQRFLDDAGIDFVASVNLLSQLPLAPSQWLLQHRPRLSDAAVNTFALALMQRHLDYLAAFPCSACLVADAEQVTHDRAGATLERTDLATHFRLDRLAYLSWWWEIAPPGELPHGAYARHRVIACRLQKNIAMSSLPRCSEGTPLEARQPPNPGSQRLAEPSGYISPAQAKANYQQATDSRDTPATRLEPPVGPSAAYGAPKKEMNG